MRYRTHRLEMRMTQDTAALDRFLDTLEGEVVAIVPNVTIHFFWVQRVNFVLIVEKLP